MLVNRVMPARHLLTVREMVESFAPDRLSVIALQSRRPDGWWRLSYGELRDWVRSLGTALLAAGVRPGDRVGVISENRSEWVITYLAVTCVGAVIVPFDVLLKAEELAAVMKAAAPVLVFTSTEYLEKVQKAQAIGRRRGADRDVRRARAGRRRVDGAESRRLGGRGRARGRGHHRGRASRSVRGMEGAALRRARRDRAPAARPGPRPVDRRLGAAARTSRRSSSPRAPRARRRA